MTLPRSHTSPRRATAAAFLVLAGAWAAWGCGGEPTGPVGGERGVPGLAVGGGALRPWAENPRYFERGGSPLLLLGGGPVATPGQTAPIDEVVANGGTHIRLWHTIPANPQPPMPWVLGGGGKYDLTQYDAGFWAGMRQTIEYAAARGVVVQVFAFSEPQLESHVGRWDLHPYNPAWNVNGLGLPPTGQSGTPAFFTLGDAPLRAVQEAYARKFAAEVGGYGNVVVELVNEYERGPNDWESHFLGMLDTLTAAPLAVNRLRLSTIGVPFGDARVQQVSYHNLPADSVFVKFRRRWGDGKVQIYDEQSIGSQSAGSIRKMAWGAVLGGGHVSWNGSGNAVAAREATRGVAGFLAQTGWEPWRGAPDSLAGPGVVPVMARGTQELVAYVAGSSVELDLTGWSGTYAASWYDPVARTLSGAGTLQGGAPRTLTAPAPERVLRLLRSDAPPPPGGGDPDGDGMPDSVEARLGHDPARKDNDVFGDAQLFTMQQYRDFLGREGDAGGVAYWTARIGDGAATRAETIRFFFDSTEFQSGTAPVARLYLAFFRRIPDQAGLQYWVGRLRAGVHAAAIAQVFAEAPEFVATYGVLDDAGFVDLVYENVLGREPDPSGRAFWLGQLAAGVSRGEMMLSFSESPEHLQASAAKVFVIQIYSGMLRRSPDPAGYDFWVGRLSSGASGLGLVQGFLDALEYRARFLP